MTNELAYLHKNGGIGTANFIQALNLAQHGWHVHILYGGVPPDAQGSRRAAHQLQAAGIALHLLQDFALPEELDRFPSVQPWLALSEQVDAALGTLHGTYRFDMIEFAECLGMGFRPIQAKRAGLRYQTARMLVKLHSSHQWIRTANQQWMASTDHWVIDYCERYSFDHADIQCSPCHYMLGYARSAGWRVRDDAVVVPYAFPQPQSSGQRIDLSAAPEVVFFGRLETRKGIDLFLQAAACLGPDVPVTFLGKDTRLDDGTLASDRIRTALPGRPINLLMGLDQEDAIRYLIGGHRLAVMPSLVDNFPNTVIECLVNCIPFLASRTGGIPEIIPEPRLRDRVLFEATTEDLLRAIQGYINATPSERRQVLDEFGAFGDLAAHNDRVEATYRRLATHELRLGASACTCRTEPELLADPLVSVVVTYYNLGDFLPETLASLRCQTYSNYEVIVVDDGSDRPHDLQVLERQKGLYPQFRFLRQDHAGLSHARNYGLSEAKGKHFISVDADNVCRPCMVERFAWALEHNPALSAWSCFFLRFQKGPDKLDHFIGAERPVGPARVLGCLLNVFGDANSIFRTDHLRAVGGYRQVPNSTCEDWELFASLLNHGYTFDVIPEYLFYYRVRSDSLLRTTNGWSNRDRVLRQLCAAENLSTAERQGLWTALLSLWLQNQAQQASYQEMSRQHLERISALQEMDRRHLERNTALRYRMVDKLGGLKVVVPHAARPLLRWAAWAAWAAGRFILKGARRQARGDKHC